MNANTGHVGPGLTIGPSHLPLRAPVVDAPSASPTQRPDPSRSGPDLARAGARIVVDDVFLGGPASQQRWRDALDGLAASGSAFTAPPTPPPPAKPPAVHRGIGYDLTVDTGAHPTARCAAQVAARVERGSGEAVGGPGAPLELGAGPANEGRWV